MRGAVFAGRVTPCMHRGWGTAQHRLQAPTGETPEESCGHSVAKETAGEAEKLQLIIIKKTWHRDVIAAIGCKRTLQHRKRRLPLAGPTTFTFQQGIFRGEDKVSPGEAVGPLKYWVFLRAEQGEAPQKGHWATLKWCRCKTFLVSSVRQRAEGRKI